MLATTSSIQQQQALDADSYRVYAITKESITYHIVHNLLDRSFVT